MEMFMRGIGLMTKLMVVASILIWMEQFMRGNGGKTSSTARELKSGQTELNTKDSTRMERSMEKVHSFGPTIQSTRENFIITIFMGRETIRGQTGGST
jgi:hypothetical protein